MTAALHTALRSYKQYVAVYVTRQAAALQDLIKTSEPTAPHRPSLLHKVILGAIIVTRKLVTFRLDNWKLNTLVSQIRNAQGSALFSFMLTRTIIPTNNTVGMTEP